MASFNNFLAIEFEDLGDKALTLDVVLRRQREAALEVSVRNRFLKHVLPVLLSPRIFSQQWDRLVLFSVYFQIEPACVAVQSPGEPDMELENSTCLVWVVLDDQR